MSRTTKSSKLVVLLARTPSGLCALPVRAVVETMRPLPTERLSGAPPYVLGISLVRGEPVPVVDLELLIGPEQPGPDRKLGRFILARTNDRRVTLAVESVVGVRELDATDLQELPPLVRGAPPERIAALGALDEQLLMLLANDARLVPEELWERTELRQREDRR